MSTPWDADLDLPGFDPLISTVRLFEARHRSGHLDSSSQRLAHNEAPHERPFLRCAVVGPPYSGKARAVRKLAEALGSSRALYVNASKLVAGSVESAAVELVLQNAQETQEPRYLFISNVHREDALTGESSDVVPTVRIADDQRRVGVDPPTTDSEEGHPDIGDVLRLLWDGANEDLGGSDLPSEPFRHPERRAARKMQQRAAGASDVRTRRAHAAPVVISKRIAEERLPVLLITTSDLPPHASIESGAPAVDLVYRTGLPRARALHQIWDQALRTVPVDATVDVGELVHFSKGYTAREVRVAVTMALHRAALSAGGQVDGLQIGQLDLLTALPREATTFRLWAREPEGSSVRRPRPGLAESRRPPARPTVQIADPKDEQYASRGTVLRGSSLDAAIDAAMIEIRNKWN